MEKKITKKVTIAILIMIVSIIIFSQKEVITSKIELNTPNNYQSTTIVDGITWNYTLEDGKATNVYYESGELGERVEIPSALDGYEVISINNAREGIYTNIFAKRSHENNNTIKEVILPNTLERIGNSAFYNCTSLTSVEIGDSVTRVGDYAFSGCKSLTNIEIGDSVAYIGRDAFNDCRSLARIEVSDKNENYASVDEVLFNKLITEIIKYPESKQGETYNIPNSVTNIYGYAFSGCKSLTRVVIPDSVTYIGSFAFSDCANLASIEIPNSVTSIGSYAFRSCANLTEIEIPNSVTSIGNGAFNWCTSLTEIELPNNVTYIGDHTFSNCTSLTNIEIGDSVTTIGNKVFNDCRSLSRIEVSDKNENYTSIDGVLFSKLMTEIIKYPEGKQGETYTIPDSVTNIYDNAFNSCKNLTRVEIPDSVTLIGSYAFSDCTSLTNIETGDSVTCIGDNAFNSCTSLTSIEIGDRVTSIEDHAFNNCASLTNIEIGDSVTSIGQGNIFSNCKSLVRIEVSNKNENYTSINGVLFNKSITEIIQYPASKQEETYVIPDSVTNIGDYAFSNCTSLTSITIPDSVTSIEDHSFYACRNLTQIQIPSSVTSIGNAAFGFCTSLTIYTNSTYVVDYANSNNISYILDQIAPNLNVIGNINKWTNKGVTLQITADDNESGISNVKVNNNVIDLENGQANYTVTKNGMYEIVATDKAGNRKTEILEIKNIDKELPNLQVEGNSTQWTREDVTLHITAEDAESGISNVKVNSNVINFEEGQANYTVTSNGIFEIVATDNAGNRTTQMIRVEKIDKEAPEVKQITGNPNNWTKENVTLNVSATDTLSGIKDYSFDGGITWQESNEKTYDNNTENIVIRVRDNAGNIAEYEPISITKITKLSSVEIKQLPEKTEYIVGEDFDAKGMKVNAIYSNGNAEEIKNYTVVNGTNLKEGQTSVTIRYEEKGETKTAIQKITVTRGQTGTKDYEIVEENGVKYIEKILPNTTIGMLKENIETNGTIEVYNGENKIENEEQKLGTGMTVKVTLNYEEESYEVVVTGDLTGDGETSIADLVRLSRYNAKLDKNLTGAYLRAAEIVRDGNIGSIADLVKLSRVLAKLDNI